MQFDAMSRSFVLCLLFLLPLTLSVRRLVTGNLGTGKLCTVTFFLGGGEDE